ncbi:hypothetical protein [Actinokineospora globicatena]|uniref:hypothetical protein n=1 Tax=Actinokineospora globicatena TaxID=103729 RepID=UPI0020A51FC8|nr:hypothetical protein [Actinokineospora globicatena]MCP2301183.1 hypothetical protein [Actinokineospora globicatena]GLW77181.1 hypothetical protein Aglo01_16630 [Actinokineospora globicatena]GLW84015.1 hypothetical protein Aglo02_16550 [Actinokineospora globicatena]
MPVDEHALRELLDGPAPAGTTSVTEVVRLGKRLVYVRVARTSLIVVLVVGMVAGSLNWLQSAPMPPAVLRSVPTEVDWPRVDLRPASEPQRLDGGEVEPLKALYRCPVSGEPQVGYGEVSGALLGATRTAVTRVLPKTKIGYWDAPTAGITADLDLTDSDGVGSLSVRSATFTGSPIAAADALAFTDSNCEPPKRHITEDGTVVQVYPMVLSEPIPTLTMRARIFRPNGLLVVLEVRNSGSIHVRDGTERQPGRPTLPMTELQLAQLAVWVA